MVEAVFSAVIFLTLVAGTAAGAVVAVFEVLVILVLGFEVVAGVVCATLIVGILKNAAATKTIDLRDIFPLI
jgi:hypothetical protein